MTDIESNSDLVALTADIAAAYVGANKISPTEVALLISSIHGALAGMTAPAVPDTAPQEPAVSVRASIKQDYLVCLEDGAKLKMLKRYLRTRYDMSPDDYRAKWNLPRDYPMVAPAYAEQRRGLAHASGLGRKKSGDAEPAAPESDVVAPATKKKLLSKARGGEPKKRGRPSKGSELVAAAPASEPSDTTAA